MPTKSLFRIYESDLNLQLWIMGLPPAGEDQARRFYDRGWSVWRAIGDIRSRPGPAGGPGGPDAGPGSGGLSGGSGGLIDERKIRVE
jgi:hypothetical protein